MSTPTETAYQYIRQKIIDGEYRPSQRLTENDLSKTIGVSRNTIKKALLKLEKENLIQIEENKGAVIKSFTIEETLNYFDIREVLEGLMIQSATLNITNEDLKTLENLLEEMEVTIKANNLTEYSKINKRFHNLIYNASSNAQAVELINIIKTQLQRQNFRTVLVPGRSQASLNEHTDILNAIKARDTRKAEEAIKRHVSNIRKTLHQNYAFLS